MKKYLSLPVIIILIFFAFTVHAQKEASANVTLSVEGSAKIKNENVAKAREEAIQNALEKAILEVGSNLSELSVKDENFQLIKRIIVQEPDKYIAYYTITQESRQEQEFNVKANVVVASAALKNDLHKMGFLHNNLIDKNNVIVFLAVKGIKSYAAYSKIKKILQSRVNLVKNIYPGTFTWQEAEFEIEMAGDTQSLRVELEQNAGCVLEINSQQPNRVDMVCKL
ncbi:MAG: flagellar assembly protein T N-terminal domain-containing protein [Syntrophaceae bacterium]|nr:flagellar assembly protein T N-terminal domain-containing protein [Syntrophaceae bacterium]